MKLTKEEIRDTAYHEASYAARQREQTAESAVECNHQHLGLDGRPGMTDELKGRKRVMT
jgi:hypothetical protein